MNKSIPLRALPRILVTNFLLQVTNDQKKNGKLYGELPAGFSLHCA